MIKFSCPKCGKKFKVPDEYAGKKGKCPKCKDSILIPGIKNKEQDASTSKQMVKFNCQTCGGQVEAPEALKGKTILCPNCGSNTKIARQETSEKEKKNLDELLLAKPTKSCPYCGETILAVAKKCKHCKQFLDEAIRNIYSQRQEPEASVDKWSKGEDLILMLLTLLFPFIGIIFGIIGMCSLSKEKRRQGIGLLISAFVATFLWSCLLTKYGGEVYEFFFYVEPIY